METGPSRPSWNIAKLDSRVCTVILVCLVAIMCYEATRLAYALRIPSDYIASFWPATPFLVAMLLLAPRGIWPAIIAAGLGAMALGDLENGVPIGSIIWFSLGDLAAVLGATLGISRLFKGVPHLSSVKTLAQYLVVAVILAPFASALLGATGSLPGGYWLQWRLWFFSDALAFLTVTPAILNWVREGRTWARRSHNYLEFAALMTSLVLFGYLAFMGTGRREPPALLYSLVPLLLWAALRLGLKGVSTSMVVVAFLSIWGAAHGRGPFAEQGPLNNVFSLQLFLFFAAMPFMFLAVLVEGQKRAQQALIDEEGQLAEAQRLAKVGSWQWDLDADRVTWSAELYRIAGLDPNLPAVSYKEHSKLYTAESWERLRHAVEEALRTGTPYELDLEMIRFDGTRRWLIAKGAVQRDTTGRAVQLRGTVHDITERKRTEEALRESEERLRLAQETVHVGVFEWDVQKNKDYRSPELERIYGVSPGSFGGTYEAWIERVHPEDRERLEREVRHHVQKGGTVDSEFRIVRPSGELRWLFSRGSIFCDSAGKPARMLGVSIDITERKRAEQALRESEERLRLAVQAGRMYAFEWNMVTDAIVRSGQCADILFWTDDPTRDTGRQFVERVYPDDREAYAVTETGLTPENPTYQTSYRMLRPDGGVIWLEESGRGFFDGKGGLLRTIGMVADVTERKLAEEALSSVSRRLIEAQEQERARIARELHDDWSQRMALLQIGLEQFELGMAGLSSQALQQLHQIAGVAAEVSSNIHNLSHQLHPAKLDTLGLVASLRGLSREFSEQHNLQVQFVNHDIPGQIPKDVTLSLFRIVQEALRNVVKHSGAAEAKVELSGHDDGIDLCISDSGAGFSPETAKGDAGLGLISMRERLRLVGGQLSVESEPSHGTRIRVSVPLFRADAEGTNEGKTRKAGA